MTSGARRDRRINVALQVTLREEEGRFLTKNLSAGGLFLITPKRYAVGSFVALSLDYKGMVIETGGRVTHIQRDGVGVRFRNPTEEMEAAIGRVIADLLATGHSQDDRRREPRQIVRETPILFRRGELEHRGELLDLSQSGARVQASKLPKEGETLLLLMSTPSIDRRRKDVDLVGSDAIVRRVLEDGFGVEFDAPSAEFRLAVARLLEQTERVGSGGG